MKRSFLIIILFFTLLSINAQQSNRFSLTSDISLSKSISVPSYTPFEWHAAGLYNINSHLAVGAGTGLSFYEKTLMPVYGDVKYVFSKKHYIMPYIEYQIGYGFDFARKSNGGLYMNPSFGIQHSLNSNLALTFSVGYDIQNLERLKTYENEYYESEFAEKLNHNSISFRIGLVFN